MRRISLAAVLAAAAFALAACGGDDENDTDSSAGGNGVDRAFVADMIPHHESAIEMAKIAQKRGKSEFVKNLADDIIRTQSAEITTLRSEDEQLASDGVEKGDLGMGDMKSMDMDMSMLETADPFDEEFMRMMIDHHQDAVDMANVELEKGGDPELKALAQDVIDAQTREIDEMREQLGEGGGSSTGEDHEMEGM